MNRSRPLSASSFLLLNFLLSCGSNTEVDEGRTTFGEELDAGSRPPAMPSEAETGDSGTEPSDGPCAAVTCESLGVLCGNALDGCGGILDCGPCGAATSLPPMGTGPSPVTTMIPPPMPVFTAPPVVTAPPVPFPTTTVPEPVMTVPTPAPTVPTPAPQDAGAPECVAETCEGLGLSCGSVADDGCGEPLDCGECVAPACEGGEILTAVAEPSTSRGMGFTGTDDDYGTLYDVPCETVADCEVACAEVGGQPEMCAASLCLENFEAGSDCLPATVWRNVTGASMPGEDIYSAAVQSMVNQEYRDYLAVEGFGFTIPEDAVVLGIGVEFLRAAGTESEVSDHEIYLVRDGQRVGAAHGTPGETWGLDLTWVNYGGATDVWGESWTAAAINSAGFGAAISAQYHQTAGNARAYVGHARITVYYGVGCETSE